MIRWIKDVDASAKMLIDEIHKAIFEAGLVEPPTEAERAFDTAAEHTNNEGRAAVAFLAAQIPDAGVIVVICVEDIRGELHMVPLGAVGSTGKMVNEDVAVIHCAGMAILLKTITQRIEQNVLRFMMQAGQAFPGAQN